jgi:NAD(P)-dependent dehydrogenase (short-subunit alcohol dehydrogenase family)
MSSVNTAKPLEGKVAIVTGAGHGMGVAITLKLLNDGARVVAVDIAADSLIQYVDQPDVVVVVGDVTESASVNEIVATAMDKFGRIDILVNNAGVMDAFMPVTEVTDELWDRVFAVNVTGPMMLCRATIPFMIKGGSGSIVNMASVAGLAGARGGAAYTASKHAVIGLTKNTAGNYKAEGIRCNAVCPGPVNTGMPRGGAPSMRGLTAHDATVPTQGRRAEPEELAEVVAFLASSAASFLTGSIIVADGGSLAS